MLLAGTCDPSTTFRNKVVQQFAYNSSISAPKHIALDKLSKKRSVEHEHAPFADAEMSATTSKRSLVTLASGTWSLTALLEPLEAATRPYAIVGRSQRWISRWLNLRTVLLPPEAAIRAPQCRRARWCRAVLGLRTSALATAELWCEIYAIGYWIACQLYIRYIGL